MQKYLQSFKSARNKSAPIVIIRTPDYAASIKEIVDAHGDYAYLWWDVCRGVVGVNDAGKQAAEAINRNEDGQPPAMVTGNAGDALDRALQFMPVRSVLFMLNLHMQLESIDPGPRISVTQGVSNCRDPFKSSQRMLVIMCPDIRVPVELTNDVITLDVELPTEEELATIPVDLHQAAGLEAPDPATVQQATAALLGLSRFSAEQITAMSLKKTGLDIPNMWDMKIADIGRVAGLRAERGGKSRFENLLGLDNIVQFGRDLLAGEEAPSIIVLLDEIEKSLGGSTGDNTGVSQDQVAQLLTSMEENQWDGMLLPGAPGCGKTEFAKCLGALAGMFIWMDLGAAKDSLVGSSEKRIRAAMSKLKAMGGSRVFIIGTCNNVAKIPGPLFRRMSAGTYFFDLPAPEAQKAIWKHYIEVYGLPAMQKIPEHYGWTGAEIRKCCQWAKRLRQTLEQSAQRITPVARTMEGELQKLRAQAMGKYLSASKPGFYTAPMKKEAARKMVLEDQAGGSK